jgi:hypothetical protein
MKNKITTTGLFLLMTFGTFGTYAGNQDSSKKDTCCTTTAAQHAPVTKNNEPDAAQFAGTLNDQVALADVEMAFQFVAAQSQEKMATADALTNLQMQEVLLEKSLQKTTLAAAKGADKSLNATQQKDFSLATDAFRPENVAKMLIASDKGINQHYAQQSGIGIASSN